MPEQSLHEQPHTDIPSLRIVFLGTPDFAVASLRALVEHGMQVVAVVTAPDKPAGRGLNLQQSPVKKYALEHAIPVLQPEKLKDPVFLEELKRVNADLQVVVAFRMLPEQVWNMPPLGTINVHASLLPQYRGAAPINWAIINGETETGVTTFQLKHEIDTGNILLQRRVPIADEETAGSLHDKLMAEGATLLVKTIQDLAHHNLRATPQPATERIRHAPKIFTATCKVDWHKPVDEIYNLIRGLSPYPGAFTYLHEKMLKIFSCSKLKKTVDEQAGTFRSDNKSFIHIACNDGYIVVDELQLEGKKRMKTADFLRGHQVA